MAGEIRVETINSQLVHGVTATLFFDQAIIPPDLVGSQLDPDTLRIMPALDVTGEWLSPNQLELTLNEDATPRTSYELTLHTPSGDHKGLLHDRTSMLIKKHGGSSAYEPIWLKLFKAPRWGSGAELLLQRAYYAYRDPEAPDRPIKKVPAHATPLRVRDALSFRKSLQIIFQMNDAEWERFSQRPADQVVPGYWMLATFPRSSEDVGSLVSLVIPEAGDFQEKDARYADETFGVAALQAGPSYHVESTQTASGEFQIELSFSAAVARPEDWGTLLAGIEWIQCAGESTRLPLTALTPTTYRSAPAPSDSTTLLPMELSFDEEQSRAACVTTLMSTGEQRELVTKLYFKLKKGADTSRLMALVHLDTLTKRISPPKDKKDKDAATASLALGEPWIRANSSLSGMPRVSPSTFSHTYKLLDEAQLRVLRFEPRGVAAVRLIRAYEHYYSPYRECLESRDNFLSYDDRQFDPTPFRPLMAQAQQPLAARLLDRRVSIVPTELLHPVEERRLTLPSGNQELTFSLHDERLYPQQRTGLYLLELSGEELPDRLNMEQDRDFTPKAVAASQSVIQHSDLGLIWKINDLGEQLFVYGFHLSTGEKIQRPHLSLYSRDAQLLHEQSISPEGSILSLPDLLGDRANQLGYLQISSGQDAYTVRLRPIESSAYGDRFRLHNLAARQEAAHTPELHHCSFSDRPIYRPGETAHVKGYLRCILGNQVSLIPAEAARQVEVRIKRADKLLSTQQLTLEADSSFALDVPIDPDDQNLADYSLECQLLTTAEHSHLSEPFIIDLNVDHFRRSEFDIQSATRLGADGQSLRVTAHAQPLTAASVAQGHVSTTVYINESPFSPEGWGDYSFGDHRLKRDQYHQLQRESKLDAMGKLELTLPQRQRALPVHQQISTTVTVTNENHQSHNHDSTLTVHPTDLYLGLRPSVTSSHVGDPPVMIDMLTVNTEGKASRAPSPITLRIEHQSTKSHGEHQLLHAMATPPEQRQGQQPQLLATHSITLDATGQGRFPLAIERAGLYTITAEGEDAQGRLFRSSITHRVEEENQRWESHELDLQSDKRHYRAGETVRLRLDRPIEGELLLTLEREGIVRHLHRRVSAQDPIIEIPLHAKDYPSLTISALHVRGGDQTSSGIPHILSGSTHIFVKAEEKQLRVAINTPAQAIRPGESCELSGQVLDAQGHPVPHATLTLYVEDENSLLTGGYTMPAPLKQFYCLRRHSIYSSSSLGQMLQRGEAEQWTWGVFERDKNESFYGSGSGSMGDGYISSYCDYTHPPLLQENPKPCALWLGHHRTDAEGRFKVQVSHSLTPARYRVIAVATQGADQFGVSSASYLVSPESQPEPSTSSESTD